MICGDDEQGWCVMCDNVECEWTLGNYTNKPSAIAAWNRRSPPAPAPAIDVEGVVKERDELLRERADLLLLWRWGAGGKVGTGFAEVLGGDGDGETWAVRFDPMSPDDSADFVVRITMGEDGMPNLDDAARAALTKNTDAQR